MSDGIAIVDDRPSCISAFFFFLSLLLSEVMSSFRHRVFSWAPRSRLLSPTRSHVLLL
jgi:hypothetical protein